MELVTSAPHFTVFPQRQCVPISPWALPPHFGPPSWVFGERSMCLVGEGSSGGRGGWSMWGRAMKRKCYG